MADQQGGTWQASCSVGSFIMRSHKQDIFLSLSLTGYIRPRACVWLCLRHTSGDWIHTAKDSWGTSKRGCRKIPCLDTWRAVRKKHQNPMALAVASVVGRVVQEFDGMLKETLSKTDLKSLITEDRAWEGFVKAAELSSEEEAALRGELRKFLAENPRDEDDGPQRKQQRQKFLRIFPPLRKKLEDYIRKLRDLAAHFDKVHKDATISNVVSSSVSTASGVLGLLGLALAPFTAGTSLVLSATSVGLGMTASATSLTTSIVEESHKIADKSEASKLVSDCLGIFDDILEAVPKLRIKFDNTGLKFARSFLVLKDQIRAFKAAISSSGKTAKSFTSAAKHLTPMTRGARIAAGGFTTFFLGWDVYHLVNESMDLYNGAKTESGKALWDLALKLEEKLQIFNQIYDGLKSGQLL